MQVELAYAQGTLTVELPREAQVTMIHKRPTTPLAPAISTVFVIVPPPLARHPIRHPSVNIADAPERDGPDICKAPLTIRSKCQR